MKLFKNNLTLASLALSLSMLACEDNTSSVYDPVEILDMSTDVSLDAQDALNAIDPVDMKVIDSTFVEHSFVEDAVLPDFEILDQEPELELCTRASVEFINLEDSEYVYFKHEFTNVAQLVFHADCNRKFELDLSNFKSRFEQSTRFSVEMQLSGSSIVGDGDIIDISLKGRHLHADVFLDLDDNGVVDHVSLPADIRLSGPLNMNLAIGGSINKFMYDPFEPMFTIYQVDYPELYLSSQDIDYLTFKIALYSQIDFDLFSEAFAYHPEQANTVLDSSGWVIHSGDFGQTQKFCAFNMTTASRLLRYVNGTIDFTEYLRTNSPFLIGFIAGQDFAVDRFLNEYLVVNNLNDLSENSCALLPDYIQVKGANGELIKLPNAYSNRPFVLGFNQ